MAAGTLLTWRTFAAIVAFRVANAFVVRTFFSPDEYYQSVEIAHSVVFGCVHVACGCVPWR